MMKANRRTVLKAAGVSLALPFLESLPRLTPAPGRGVSAQRLISVGTFLGLYGPAFFPQQAGRGYTTPKLLEPLESLRGEFTVFSGLDHRAPNGHKHWRNFLTGPETGHVSFDQVVAEAIGANTRFSSLELTCGDPSMDGKMCFTKEGVSLPLIGRPRVLFRKLFGSETDKERLRAHLDSGKSVLDQVLRDARRLRTRIGVADREKLDQYFTSIREVEQDLLKQRAWIDKPTQTVHYELPAEDPVAPAQSLECESIMYDLMALAIQTDSTRVISFLIPGEGQVFTLDGKKQPASYHGLSHHGNDPKRVEEYTRIGWEHTRRLAAFLKKVAGFTDAEGRSLLESTVVLYGSGMGDANVHSNSHLPVLVAGGGFQHGGHVVVDRTRSDSDGPLLGDLFLTLSQRLGLNLTTFANASRGMSDLLLAR